MKSKFKINRKKVLIIVIVIFAILVVGIASYKKAKNNQPKQVTMSTVTKNKIIQSTTVTGNIEPKSRDEVTFNNTQKVTKVMVTEGQQVKAGDILVQMDTSDYDSELKKQKINLKNAENASSQMQSTLGGANKQGGENQTDVIKAEIDSLNAKIEASNIKSNIDGRVMKVNVKENELPKTGDSIIIDDTSQYKVSVDMSQYDAMKVAVGQKANIKIKGSDKKYTGSVAEVGKIAESKVDTKAGTTGSQEAKVNVKITLDSADDTIKAGYEATAEVIFNEKVNVLCIGFDGIKEDKSTKRKYVYIVNNKNKIEKRYINTGIETDDYVEVLNGLKDGDKYVSNPADSLKEGDVVEQTTKAQAGGTKK